MKIALSWLKNYIDLPENIDELAELLTFAGIEVEALTRLEAVPKSVIAAKVVSAERVPKTDHLQLCRVDIGSYDYPEKAEDNTIQVVCGAPNCHSGMMAVLALPGSKLAEMDIKVAKIRGVVSHGMLCSERELGISENHAGIIELPAQTPIGADINELYELPDAIFELEITPNRSDLLGYKGIARDLAAKLARALKEPATPELPVATGDLKLGLHNEEPGLCPRYTARIIQGVKIAQSPLWLKLKLIKSGLRPINNVVDITNFVMYETGQPLHAFDFKLLTSREAGAAHPDIVVRKAYPQEEIVALDGKNYILDGDELVIADGKKASAIAGVMGSEYSGITFETRNIVLESATFFPGSVRKTSYKHKISTDSSYRFERHLSAEYADKVSARATELILKLAGGELAGELYDSYPQPEVQKYISVRPARFELLIGYTLSDTEIKDYLQKLDFEYQGKGRHQKELVESLPALEDKGEAHYYAVPAYRKDISREADVLEELARLSGYDKVPQITLPQQIMDRHAYYAKRKAMQHLVAWGAYETLNYSFSDPRQMQKLGFEPETLPFMKLINPQSQLHSVMRVSLVPQLLDNLAYNLNHGARDIRLFEQGKVYLKTAEGHEEPTKLAAIFCGSRMPGHWQSKPQAIDFYWLKGCFEALLAEYGIAAEIRSFQSPYQMDSESFAYYAQDSFVGSIGRIKPAVLAKWDIDSSSLKQEVWLLEAETDILAELSRNKELKFQPLSRFPAVSRDLSFLAPENISFGELKSAILALDSNLIQAIELFDEYRSKQIAEGFRSLSLHFVLQDQEKTLTDEAVEHLMAQVQKTLIEKYEIKMR
ncbi:MAG: phenylalanine--tRNA ligase subunit beta [Candidatus Cloacimonadaceae bacterium]